MQPGKRVAAIAVLALAAASMLWQPVRAQPAGQQRPPAGNGAAPRTPVPSSFKAVAITLPEPFKDPSFEAFRKELAGIVQRKDRTALGKLVVAKGFFWERERGDGADPKKTPYANLAAALGIDLPDDPDAGWDTLAIYADDPTVFGLSDRPGVMCGPADPGFNEDEFDALLKATRTDVGDWVYPVSADVGLRAAPRTNAPAADKVGLIFIRVVATDMPADQANAEAADFIRVTLPSGKIGYVKIAEIASLGVSQVCYVKDGATWKIAGVLGGADQ